MSDQPDPMEVALKTGVALVTSDGRVLGAQEIYGPPVPAWGAVAVDSGDVCCQSFGACTRPCTPRGRWMEQRNTEALRQAGLTLIGLAAHDQHCEVFDLDDDGRHKACSCGLDNASDLIRAAGTGAT